MSLPNETRLTNVETLVGEGATAGVAKANTAVVLDANKAITGLGAVSAASVTGINVPLIVQCGTQVDVTSSTTLVDITGLTATVAAGTYDLEVNLYGTADTNGGWKVAFALTTAVLSAVNTSGFAWLTATAPAITNNTTKTSGTTILTDKAALTNGVIRGTLTFSTGGTFKLQFAQNTSDATASSIYVGSSMKLTRTA